MLSITVSTFTRTIYQLEIQKSMYTSHQDPENGTKKFLKTSILFKISIYQQEKEIRLLTTLLQIFQTKYCILTYYGVPQLATMMHRKYQQRFQQINTNLAINLFMKNFNIHKYIDDFKQLPFSIVYSFDNPDGQLDNLHKIIRTIHRTSRTFKKSKIYSPFSSMDDPDIVSLQNQRNKLRYEAHSKRTAQNDQLGVHTGKQKRNTTGALFYKNILNSKNTKHIWKVIHPILNPKSST